MLLITRIKFITCIVILWVAGANAQYKFEKAVLFNKENGFPTTGIRYMIKGDDGFVWVGSDAGLSRFDGYSVKQFTEGKDLRYSLFDNRVLYILPVKNKLWIATGQGISVMNLADYSFHHYQLSNKGKTDSLKRKFDQAVNVLYLDRQGKIWVGTVDRGIAVYDETKDDFQFYTLPRDKNPPLSPSLAPNTNILSIIQSEKNDSIIWAGSTSGLWQINKYTNQVELFAFQKESKDYQVALNAFRRLYHHAEDNLLYVGSWAAGVNIFDPVKKTFLPMQASSPEAQAMVRSVIGGVKRKSDHEIWVSTLLGLSVYDTRVKDITWLKKNKPEQNQYYSVNFIDERNRVWYADINGINCYDPAVQQFSTYSFKQLGNPQLGLVFYICSNSTGDLITICPRFTDCIYLFDKKSGEFTKINFPRGKKFTGEREVVKGFVQLSPGEYIIASDQGVYRYFLKNNTLKQVTGDPFFAPTRRSNIVKDAYGNVWLSDVTWGLTKWDPVTGQLTHYKSQLLPEASTGSVNGIGNLFADSRGNVWFQRNRGIGVYVSARDTVFNFLFEKNESNSFPTAGSFAEDKKGRIWVSSTDNWIGYMLLQNPERGVVYKLNTSLRGIKSPFFDLAANPAGEIWGQTDKELVKINMEDLSFTTYSFQYGAADADFFHFSFLPTGEMIFGGRYDITIANPAELKRNTELPVPYISEVLVLNQPVRFNNGQALNLSHQQNFFSLGFSAQAFTMAGDVKFRYRLMGFDDWSEVSTRRFANYTNVPAGDYFFQVQAMNNEGLWNDKILELPVHIDTAFWETWWFRLLIITGIGAIVFPLYNFRENQVRKKEQLKAAYEKKITNLEMSSLLAQMNPHFLFNSLNSIDSYIIKNDTLKASEYLNNFARLMRLILQNSRSNYISLKDELESLELYLQMEQLRFNNKFEYAVTVDKDVNDDAITIPPMLIQPYVENAIWHGLMHKNDGTKGLVKINISIAENKLKCIVEDNGIGRDRAEEIKAQKTANHKRSMGMEITRDRMEMLKKLYGTDTKVEITDLYDNNKEATGTRVELIIPF